MILNVYYFFGINYSPMVRKRKSTNAYEYDFDPQSIKRVNPKKYHFKLYKLLNNFF
jgi:hypothetical protein